MDETKPRHGILTLELRPDQVIRIGEKVFIRLNEKGLNGDIKLSIRADGLQVTRLKSAQKLEDL